MTEDSQRDDPHEVVALDYTGLQCPMPIARLALATRGLADGCVVEVRATDPAFPFDLEAWLELTGHEPLGVEQRDGLLVAHLRVRGGRRAA